MAKKVKNLFKKLGKAYLDSVILYYKPLVDAKVNPWL